MKNKFAQSAEGQVIAGQVRKILLIILLAAINLFPIWNYLGFVANAQSGFSDPFFFSGNKISTDIANSDDFSQSAVIQPDGKMVVAGYSHNGSENDFVVVRYNNNGMIDYSFGMKGKAVTDIKGTDEEAYSVAIQLDGKIVVAGEKFNDRSTDFSVVRYNSDGSLDKSFADQGIATTSIGNSDAYCHSVAIGPNGKIYLAGQSFNGCNWDMAVACYNNEGISDKKFGIKGKVMVDINNSNDHARSVVIQPDGKIILGGTSSGKFAVLRLGSDGVPDGSFGSNGIVLADVEGLKTKCNSVCLQKDGKIVAAGWSSAGFAIMRFNTNGLTDLTFGSNGIVSTSLGSGGGYGLSAAIDHKERIIVGGKTIKGLEQEFVVVRYNRDGSIDNTFYQEGRSNAEFDGRSIVIDKDGNIVVVGSSFNGKNSDFSLIRHSSEDGEMALEQREENIKMIGTEGTRKLTVFPNPSSGSLSIKAGAEGTYSLINELGQTVEIFRLNDVNNFTRDIEYLPNGTYHVIGLNGNMNTIKNVVVAN